jgi:hypothetical protein
MRQKDGTYKAQGDQAKTSAELTPAFAERDPTSGRIDISQGIILETTLPNGASKALYDAEMRRPAAWEASAGFGALRSMASEVERMSFRSTQEAENVTNFWMQRAFNAERDRLISEFDRPLTGTPQY